MKKLFYSFAMLALLVGCSDDATDDGGKKEPEPEPTPTEQVITATFEESEIDLAWAEGDAISVFHSLANEKWAYNEEAAGFKKADNTAPTKKLNYVFGIYPYNDDINAVSNSNEITLNFPSKQTYVANGFDAAQAPMLAVAEKDATALEFKPAYALVSVKVFGNTPIKEVVLEGGNKEKIAGTATATIEVGGAPTYSDLALSSITMALGEGMELATTEDGATTFTFAVAPGTFSRGFSVLVTDVNDNPYRKAFNAEVVADRNTSITLEGSFEIVAKTVVKTIFDAQFNLDGTVTDKGIFGLTVETKKNEAGETPNMFVYTHPEFEGNNIAHFNFVPHNEMRNHSYFELNYEQNEEFKAALEGGLTFEIVTAHTFNIWDWWQCPAATDTFRFFHKCDANNNIWVAGFNGKEWWPWNQGGQTIDTSTYLVKNQYQHSVYVYDATMQAIYTYTNGVKDGERTEVIDFLTGNRLTIGGYPHQNGGLAMAYSGDVAMVKIYDQPLSEEEVAEKYAALSLPETTSVPAPAEISAPLLDIKWDADKQASNAGTQTSLTIQSVPSATTSVVNVDGFGYVLNTGHKINNDDFFDGFYRVDYSQDADFKSKLQDGFTMELICIHNGNPGDYWVRPVSSDSWGLMLHTGDMGATHHWRVFGNGDNGHWGHHGGIRDFDTVIKRDENVVMTSFDHLLFVYSTDGTHSWSAYYNGKEYYLGGNAGDFNVGNYFNVNGMPYNDVKAAHGFNGGIAVARIFDETFSSDQMEQRYKDIKPTLDKLNASLAQ